MTEKNSSETFIHPTSIVHPKAQLDHGVKVGPWCTIGENVRIGKNTELRSHVVVEGWTEMGESNVVFPFAVLGAVPQDLKYKGESTELVIGNRNTIRESVTLNLGTAQGGGITKLGDDCLLMAYVHMGHDSRVGNRCILANAVGLAGHVTIHDDAILGGMCGVSQFVRVGSHAYVGGQTGVEKDIPPFAAAMGSRPITLKGANIVGLKRKGFSTEVISKLNETIKIWAKTEIPKEQCLSNIESQFGDVPEVQQFLNFIRASEYGVAR